MKQIALALTVCWIAALAPVQADARSLEAECKDPGRNKPAAAAACLSLLGQTGLSVEERINLHRLRGTYLEDAYDYGIALFEENHVLRLRPGDLDAVLSKARLLDKLGNQAKAVEMIRAAQADHPDDFRPLQEEFKLLQRAECKGGAMDFAEAIVLRFPKSPEAYVMRAHASILLRNLPHAMDDYHVAFLYGDHSAETIRGFLTACQWSMATCPHLFPNGRIAEPNLSCDQARDWTLARMRERPDLRFEKRNPMVFTSPRLLQQGLDDHEAAVVEGGMRLGVFAVAAYVGATLALINEPDLRSAVRVIVSERLLRCFYDNDPLALLIIERARSKAVFSEEKVSFGDVWHRDVRTNLLDYAYQVRNSKTD